MLRIDCPVLVPPFVEITDERLAHITKRHPDLLPAHKDELIETIRSPDAVLPNRYRREKVTLYKWFPNVRGGKFLVVQVVTESGTEERVWVVTAYLDHDRPS